MVGSYVRNWEKIPGVNSGAPEEDILSVVCIEEG
jgi:hypothetical protein